MYALKASGIKYTINSSYLKQLYNNQMKIEDTKIYFNDFYYTYCKVNNEFFIKDFEEFDPQYIIYYNTEEEAEKSFKEFYNIKEIEEKIKKVKENKLGSFSYIDFINVSIVEIKEKTIKHIIKK